MKVYNQILEEGGQNPKCDKKRIDKNLLITLFLSGKMNDEPTIYRTSRLLIFYNRADLNVGSNFLHLPRRGPSHPS